MAYLKIGTCSWKYDSWSGLVYDEKTGKDYLRDYAGHFDTVEVDQWFWSLHGKDSVTLPKDEVVKKYVESVPEDFTFTIKVPNSITLTHFYRKNRAGPLVENPHFLSPELFHVFLDRLAPMKSRLGPLMFQFEYLNKQKMASQSRFQESFENFVAQCPADYAYAIEIRNPNYLNSSYFDFINRNSLAHVFLQGYYMPPVYEVYGKYSDQINDCTVLRLHGPDRKAIEDKTKKIWNQIVEPRDEDLSWIIPMIQNLMDRYIDIYVNVNNHYEGSAPLTIRKIKSRIG